MVKVDQLFLSNNFMEDHKMSKYLVYLINTETTCDCLTWVVLYKKLC